MWKVTSVAGDIHEAHFFIQAIGAIHKPYRPHFKVPLIMHYCYIVRPTLYLQNIELFKKPIIHTAEWDASLDLSDKRVAVIGTGCSAVQLVPSIADKVKELYLFQRTPAWVRPR
jgi:cation diffusion facilitator CzcD-associated flavoprotein CzcO